MSVILKFPLERVKRRSYEPADDTINADILVFEGVRYEKDDSPKNRLKQK